ncbi:MAG: XF1762 family protein [Pseudomonadota bacterium]
MATRDGRTFLPQPLSLKQANALVERLHRHAKPVRIHRFSIGAVVQATGKLCGAVIVSNPVARSHISALNLECEVRRVVTDGTPDACSFLYAAAVRAATAMGFVNVVTYTRVNEPGTSLRAAGFDVDGTVQAKSWDTPSRRRYSALDPCARIRWIKWNTIRSEKWLAVLTATSKTR